LENEIKKRIIEHLSFLYGEKTAESVWVKLQKMLKDFNQQNPELANNMFQFSEQDAILVTYGDQLRSRTEAPLHTLHKFLKIYLKDTVNGIHILPFFPYSSDDGFAIIDYAKINLDLGTWDDIEAIAQNYKLMIDFVLNHISSQSSWFEEFKAGNQAYQDFFILVEPGTDLSSIVRPRALPLITPVETSQGTKYVWTTFSTDQIDLNFTNPAVTIQMVEILLEYIRRGAKIIRLDAIAYLWKIIGTPSIHLPQTHHFVKLLRSVLDAIAPGVILITETNVPYQENISYFGKPLDLKIGENIIHTSDEAQMVYQFSLAPLVLHAFQHQDTTKLSDWAAGISKPIPGAVFFNFLASHDGIGIRPAEGMLDSTEIQLLVERTLQNGGQVSYKNNPDGSKSPYELNITLYDWLAEPDDPSEEIAIERFMASQAIMLSLIGVPGIYFHSLIGSSNCDTCVAETGRARSINREKLSWVELITRFDNPQSRTNQIFTKYVQLLAIRRKHPAFHPSAPQQILQLDSRIVSVLRLSVNSGGVILALINVTGQFVRSDIDQINLNLPAVSKWLDLITNEEINSASGKLQMTFSPYQYLWLTPAD
jgi:glycosidase